MKYSLVQASCLFDNILIFMYAQIFAQGSLCKDWNVNHGQDRAGKSLPAFDRFEMKQHIISTNCPLPEHMCYTIDTVLSYAEYLDSERNSSDCTLSVPLGELFCWLLYACVVWLAWFSSGICLNWYTTWNHIKSPSSFRPRIDELWRRRRVQGRTLWSIPTAASGGGRVYKQRHDGDVAHYIYRFKTL